MIPSISLTFLLMFFILFYLLLFSFLISHRFYRVLCWILRWLFQVPNLQIFALWRHQINGKSHVPKLFSFLHPCIYGSVFCSLFLFSSLMLSKLWFFFIYIRTKTIQCSHIQISNVSLSEFTLLQFGFVLLLDPRLGPALLSFGVISMVVCVCCLII